MTHNLLISLQNMEKNHYWENRHFCSRKPEPFQSDIIKPVKKKVKRTRTAFTTKQLRTLERIYTQHKYITTDRRREISKALNLGDKSVKIWFQNRRMKEKRESTESSPMDSDSSNESNVCVKSPSPTVLTESDNSDQIDIIANEIMAPETCEYQVPYVWPNNINEQQIENVNACDYNTVQTNGMQYYNDTNMYLTQYYPFNGGNYPNGHNYYQYQPENLMLSNYWTSNNYEPCYFYNEGT